MNMIERLLEFLNLTEDQKKQFDQIKSNYETKDEEIDKQLKELMKEKKESWKSRKQEFENILNEEQKDRMRSLFDLFSPFKGFGKKGGFRSC